MGGFEGRLHSSKARKSGRPCQIAPVGLPCLTPACLPLCSAQVCNHPYLFSFDAEPDFDGTTGEDIVEASGKMHVGDLVLP